MVKTWHYFIKVHEFSSMAILVINNFEKRSFSLNFFLEDKLGSHESHDKSQINSMEIRSNCSYYSLLRMISFKVTKLKLIMAFTFTFSKIGGSFNNYQFIQDISTKDAIFLTRIIIENYWRFIYWELLSSFSSFAMENFFSSIMSCFFFKNKE